MNHFIFLGAPGAGKGTQSEIISKKLNIPKLSTGDILREAIKNKTELGKKVSAIMSRGLLVDDTIVVQIVSERLSEPDCENGFILDGFPRNINQATELDNILKRTGDIAIKVILLDVAEDVLIKRISGRYFCKQCNACYNEHYHPMGNACEVCGCEKIYRRDDDNITSVKRRLEIYNEQTKPLISYYKEKGCLMAINGEQETEDISNSIISGCAPQKETMSY